MYDPRIYLAYKLARQIVGMVQATMALECQGLDKPFLYAMMDKTIHELLVDSKFPYKENDDDKTQCCSM